MALRMRHARYGERDIRPEQLESYERTGWQQIAEPTPEPVDTTINGVLRRVGDDVTAAREALLAEQERSKPRKRLVAALTELIELNTTATLTDPSTADTTTSEV